MSAIPVEIKFVFSASRRSRDVDLHCFTADIARRRTVGLICSLTTFQMLSSMLKEYHIKQARHREAQERKRSEAMIATSTLASSLVEHLNKGVAQAYVNQKKLDTETKILQANVVQFSKQANQWLRLINDFNQLIKEIGDVENWSRSIEADTRTISSALEYAYKSS